MKKGDKVLCVVNCKLGFTKGQTYIINSQEINYIFEIISIIQPHHNRGLAWFRVNQPGEGYWNFDDYFITIKKQRKLKLEKLNENR